MPNTCGYTVFSSSTNSSTLADLYPLSSSSPKSPEYKTSTYTLGYTIVIRQLAHRIFAQSLSVINRVVPIVHSTNKNYKKFYTNNLLLIYTGVVYK